MFQGIEADTPATAEKPYRADRLQSMGDLSNSAPREWGETGAVLD